MTNEQIFVRFLKEKRKYSSFKRQMDPTRPYFNCSPMFRPIDRGLVWLHTEEGHDYWKNLHKEWKELYDHFNLEGVIDLRKI